MNVIQFPEAGNKHTDTDGNTWQKYDIEYIRDGLPFIFKIWARSFADAEETLENIKNTAEVGGRLTSF